MQRLLMIAPAPVVSTAEGYILDGKFLSGMEFQSRSWHGNFDCLLREGVSEIPFGAEEVTGVLPFGLKVLKQDQPITSADLDEYDIVYCAIDSAENLDVINLDLTEQTKFFATIEYTLWTRLQIAWLNKDIKILKRMRTTLWLLRQEHRRRRFMRKADGLQTNGYPAFNAYRHLNRNTLLYLDNRMTEGLFASDENCEARADRLLSGAPLKLVYSGRLERMKGAHDLIPIANGLKARGIAFHLDIFGAGSLKSEILDAISQGALSNEVTLHEPVDFETKLIPYLRENCDIYVCCHRQSDPSCSYIENMGCGLAIVGFGNQMWSSLKEASGAGWVVPVGAREELIDVILRLDRNREEVLECSDKALNFARSHNFIAEFQRRMDHLRRA